MSAIAPTTSAPASSAAEILGCDGPFAQSLERFCVRHQQQEVASAVEDAIANNLTLLVEAGTGIGKTFAYLVPALLSGKKIVISTGTKTLQDQLVLKDLPTVCRIIKRDPEVAVLKGRANYLCIHRTQRLGQQLTLPGQENDFLEALEDWQIETATGDLSELAELSESHRHRKEITATPDQCLGRRCDFYDACWVTQARRRAQRADIVVVNHHLYLADMSLRAATGDDSLGIIPDHDIGVFDEAHDLDEIARHHFGYSVSDRRFDELCDDIMRAAPAEVAERAQTLSKAVRARASEFYGTLPFRPSRVRLHQGQIPPKTWQCHEALDDALRSLEGEIAGWEVEEAQGLSRRIAALAFEVAIALGQQERQSAVVETIVEDGVLEGHDPTPPYVYFTERQIRSRALFARPVDVASLLGDRLKHRPAIFLSATLAVGQSFEHYCQRTGLPADHTLCVDSPFSYESHAALYIPGDIPYPNDEAFAQVVPRRAAELVQASGGGALILCTSYRMIEPFARAIGESFEGTILRQGDKSRAALLEEFKNDVDSVLVATQSFWKGIDVPGPALRLVMMDRIPFAVPTDPVEEARVDYLKSRGISPFPHHQLPHAALSLRQGFGRLIRTESDRGLVAIFDRRLRDKGYGKKLLHVLPPAPILNDLDAARLFLSTQPDI